MNSDHPDKMNLEDSSAAGASVPTRIPPATIRPDDRDRPSASSRNAKNIRSDPPELIAIPGYVYNTELHRSKRTILYRAQEEKSGRDVVIKQFKDQEEFDREKESQNSIIDSASDKDYFLLAYTFLDELKTMITPYLRGGDLYTLPDKVSGIIKPSQTWVLGLDLFGALQIMHDLNLVHRDVKSRNVLVDITDPALKEITAETLESYTDLNFKLFDFEFAAHRDLSEQGDEGKIIGTPRYMAPEVCLGERYDPRSDIYSAVIILYRLLAKRYPIDGGNYLQTIQRQIRDDIPDITEFNRHITPGQNAVLKKGLAKKPKDRYQTAQEFKLDWFDELTKK